MTFFGPLGLSVACVFLVFCSIAALAEEPAPDARIGIIPQHWKVASQDVPMKPCWQRMRYPCYDEIRTPIYEWKMVERWTTVKMPVAAPVRLVRERVIPGKPACGCSPAVPGMIVRTPVGSTPAVAPAVRTKVVKLGKMPGWFKTGERVSKKLRGYGWKRVNVNEGRTRKVPSRSFVRKIAVTVVESGDATMVEPLPGTKEVLTRKEFDAAMQAAAASPATPR